MNVHSEFHKRNESGELVNISGYIPGLDGLRAISIILVILSHSGFGNIIPGGLGVTIFFFISGYLITNLIISEIQRTNTINIWAFCARRFLRLAPELYFYLLFAIIMNSYTGRVDSLEFAAAFAYMMNYYKIFSDGGGDGIVAVSHFWSLAIEEHFYLLFPTLYLLFRKKWKLFASILLAWCLFSPFMREFLYYKYAEFGTTSGSSAYTYYATEARIDSILYGCIFAILTRKLSIAVTRQPAVGVMILLISGALMISSLLIRDEVFRSTWRYSLQGASLFLFFYVLYFSTLGAGLLAVLEIPVLTKIGRLSYGMYIWHLVPIYIIGSSLDAYGLVGGPVRSLMVSGAAVVISAIIADLSQKYILSVFGPLRKRLGSHGMKIA